MAGRHRRPATGERVEFTVRMPAALKAHLSDLATAHGRSLNEEILVRLMTEGQRRQGLRQDLLELEPKPDDPRTDKEIVAAMDKVYERWQVPQVEDMPTPPERYDNREWSQTPGGPSDAQVDETLAITEWLSRGGWPKR